MCRNESLRAETFNIRCNLSLMPLIRHCTDSRLIHRGPAGSSSRGGDVTVYVCDINQPSLPTPFKKKNSVLVSVFVSMAPFSTVFHSITSPTTLRFLSLFF